MGQFDEDISTTDITIPPILIEGTITRSRAHQLKQQVNSFLCSSSRENENRLLPNDVLVLRNEGEGYGVLMEHQGCVEEQGGRAPPVGSRVQLNFESTSEFHRSQRETSKQVSIQNLSGCCVTVFWPVGPCIVLESIRGASRGLARPNPYLFSSRRHFRVLVLLRFILSSNSVAVHRFVRPHFVINTVLIATFLFLLVFSVALAEISLLGEVIRATRVITNGAVV